MIGHDLSRGVADLVSSSIEGQRQADHVLDEIKRGTTHPDQLHTAAMKSWGDFGSPGLLGFHRRIQKALERA